MKKTVRKKPTIQIGAKRIEIGPDAVPSKPGKSIRELIQALKKAVQEEVFPPPGGWTSQK